MQKHRACERAASHADDRRLCTGNLAAAAIAAQLHACLVQVPETVQPPGRELPAAGIDW